MSLPKLVAADFHIYVFNHVLRLIFGGTFRKFLSGTICKVSLEPLMLVLFQFHELSKF